MKQFDIIIVGGGVVGSASAYYLKKHGFTGSIAIVEQDTTWQSGCTARSAGGIRQQFSTLNVHRPHEAISMRLRDGPFARLDGEWRFLALREDACKVEFGLEYAFARGLLGRALAPVFDQIARSFIDAFVRRADQLHGR